MKVEAAKAIQQFIEANWILIWNEINWRSQLLALAQPGLSVDQNSQIEASDKKPIVDWLAFEGMSNLFLTFGV